MFNAVQQIRSFSLEFTVFELKVHEVSPVLLTSGTFIIRMEVGGVLCSKITNPKE